MQTLLNRTIHGNNNPDDFTDSADDGPHSRRHKDSQRLSEQARLRNLLQVAEKERIESTGRRRRTVKRWSSAKFIIGAGGDWWPLPEEVEAISAIGGVMMS